jgi:acyl CoA:acetate/3-ketoacid CoA transferase alpha subunit/acyl CoA:acetate/3-ketoacid CoA transferase beta subunit
VTGVPAIGVSLESAVAEHVRPGDSIVVSVGQHRWSALLREVARQYWDRDPGFELIMPTLGTLTALLLHRPLVRRVVTAYSGDAFPTYGPNPIFTAAYRDGVEVEHWSFLTLAARLEAAARGLAAMVTRSVAGSSMAGNDGYVEVDGGPGVGPVSLVTALPADVAVVHAPVADTEGNLAAAPPLLDGPWGAFAARRGVIATVERIIPDISPWQHYTRIPGHRVLAVVAAPHGAHPGGVYAPGLPVTSYLEDIEFGAAARTAARGDFAAWARRWCLEVPEHADYLAAVGADRLAALSWAGDRPPAGLDTVAPAAMATGAAAQPITAAGGPTAWEAAAVHAARYVADLPPSSTVLAGAGVANLAAWLGHALATGRGTRLHLAAEIGLWDYRPEPGNPFVFNAANFPTARMATDLQTVLGLLIPGPGTRSVAVVGAGQLDRYGNINTTRLADGRHLVGSGGGNDVASGADECLVVTLLRPRRTPERLPYVTGPGRAVRRVCTDLGVLARDPDRGELVLVAVPGGPGDRTARIRRATGSCGWPLRVAREVADLPAPTGAELDILRGYDPARWFLG